MDQGKQQHTIVCIDGHPKTMMLLRIAARRAKDTGCTWSALFVETPNFYRNDESLREQILRFLTAAKEMGASIHQIEANDIVSGVREHLKECEENGTLPTHMLLGETKRDGIWALLNPSTARKIERALHHRIELRTVPLTRDHEVPETTLASTAIRQSVKLSEIGYGLLAVFIAYLATETLRMVVPRIVFLLNDHNVSLIFLIACAFTAGRYGLIPGLIASLTSFFAINVFYIEPLYQLRLTGPTEAINLLLFLFAALILSLFGSYNRAHARAIAQRARRTQALYDIQTVVSKATTRSEAFTLLYERMQKWISMDLAYFLPNALSPDDLEAAIPEEVALDALSLKARDLCWQELRATGAGTPIIKEAAWRFEPMATELGDIGVLGIKIRNARNLDAAFGKLHAALAQKSAIILERLELAQEIQETRISEEREKLRAMLLSSVSHDLKTPLASIIGSLSAYHSMYDSLPDEQKRMLTATALDEAQRLDSFISNILDMTKIESGDIRFKREWCSPDEIVATVAKRLRQRLTHHTLTIERLKDRIEVEADQMLLEQVVQNLLDNAAKYAPAGTEITVSMTIDDHDAFTFSVRDRGQGIPDGEQDAIFDKYTRLKKTDSKVAGTGLGLAICKSIMEGMKGSIAVYNHEKGGAVFQLKLHNWRDADEARKEKIA